MNTLKISFLLSILFYQSPAFAGWGDCWGCFGCFSLGISQPPPIEHLAELPPLPRPEEIMSVEDIEDAPFPRAFILVIEDTQIIRMILVHFLTNMGFRVFEAVNGQEAIDFLMARTQIINLVITDINMPVLDGVNATRIIRERALVPPETAILGFTDATDAEIEELRNSGATEIFAKNQQAALLEKLKKIFPLAK